MLSNSRYLLMFSSVFWLMFPIACVKEISEILQQPIDTSLVGMRFSTPEIKKREPKITPVDPNERDPGKENLTCTDLVKMNIEATGFPIYVDINAETSGDGSSWKQAIKGVALGLKRAFELRSELLRASGPSAHVPIYILVAGGEYTFSHEDEVIRSTGSTGLGANESLVRFAGIKGDIMKNIHLQGGYSAGDRCLELDFNRLDNPSDFAKRESILDGENQSNHVIIIASERGDKSVADIHISSFTVKGGFAQGSDASDPEISFLKKTGGGLAIRGSVHDVQINHMKFESNRAHYNGGCLAVAQSASLIYFGNNKFSGCIAGENGGAVYIGEKVSGIAFDGIDVESSQALGTGNLPVVAGLVDPLASLVGGAWQRPTGHGGAIYIAGEKWNGEQHGVNGPSNVRIYENLLHGSNYALFTQNVARFHGGAIAMAGKGLSEINLMQLSIDNNRAGGYGGGVAIFKTGTSTLLPGRGLRADVFPPARFELLNCQIHHNQINAAGGGEKGGGGLAVFDNAELVAIKNGFISNNTALEKGGGVLIEGNVNMVSFDDVMVEQNILGAAGRGAGVYISEEGANRPERVKFAGTTIQKHQNVTTGAGLYASGVSGLWLIDNTIIAFNKSSALGGGAFLSASDYVSIKSTRFNDNSSANGGGLYFYDSHSFLHADTTYRNNSSTGRGGALLVRQSRNRDRLAGAPMLMKDIKCEDNSSSVAGGCAYFEMAPGTVIDGGEYINNGLAKPAQNINQVTASGGALYYLSDSLNVGATDFDAKLAIKHNAQFRGNQALNGGALYTENVFELEIDHAQFIDNKATKDNAPLGQGGAIYGNFTQIAFASNALFHTGARISIANDSLLQGNEARGSGGAFYGANLYSFSLSNLLYTQKVSFLRNKSGEHGGALYLDFFRPSLNSVLDIRVRNEFAENHAKAVGAMGGAIYVAQAPENITLSGEFRANEANNGGGAVNVAGNMAIRWLRVDSSSLFLDNITEQNSGGALFFASTVAINAFPPGGALYADPPGGFSGKFTNNQALNGMGGGVAFMGPLPPAQRFLAEKAGFDSNRAQYNSAIHIQPAHIPIEGFEFRYVSFRGHQRTTPGCGGVMDLSAANIDDIFFDQVSLEGNAATNGNGGAFCVGNVLNNVSISNNDWVLRNLYRGVLRRVMGRLPYLEDMPMFHHNSASGNGGAFYFGTIGHQLLISHPAWISNSANGGSGGAIYVGNMGGDVEIKSPLLYGNQAAINGGAIHIEDMQGHNFSMNQTDRENAFNPLNYLPNHQMQYKPFPYLKNYRSRIDAGDVYPMARELGARTLYSLNGTDVNRQKRGIFLVEANRAGASGGALFVNNPNYFWVADMSFGNNEALAGGGGTLNVNNLQGVMLLTDSLIFGGRAKNGGGLWVNGTAHAGDPQRLWIRRSSIQACEAGGPILAARGSAGIYADQINGIYIEKTNFFANRIVNAQPGSSWAAALSYSTRSDPLFPMGPMLFDPAPALADPPVKLVGPIIVRDNIVQGAFNPLASTGTISIPNAIFGTANNFIYNDNNVFMKSDGTPSATGNVPAPPGNLPPQVVKGH